LVQQLHKSIQQISGASSSSSDEEEVSWLRIIIIINQ
jgi:hypothetical protein